MRLTISRTSISMTRKSDQDAAAACPCTRACPVQKARICSRSYLSDITGTVVLSRAACRGARTVGRRIDHGVARPVHHAEMHARKVLTDNAEGEQLGAGEDHDHRCQKRKTRHWVAFQE